MKASPWEKEDAAHEGIPITLAAIKDAIERR